MDANAEIISEDSSSAPDAAGDSSVAEISAAATPDSDSATEERTASRDASAHSPGTASSTHPIGDAGSEYVKLGLVPFSAIPEDAPFVKGMATPSRGGLAKWGLVASLACLTLAGATLAYDRAQEWRLLTAKIQETQYLASTVNLLKGRLDALEAGKGREETADLRKVLSEIKAGTSATRDASAALTQLSTRVDHIERDQSARLDKFSDRIDRESSARLTEIASRLDRLERKSAAQAVASASPAPPLPPKPGVGQGRGETAVSNETTGSIEKPRPRLRGYTVEEVRDGYAIVDSRDGPQSVSPGDFIPGAGRVLRIERRGREWAVLTSLGVITSEPAVY